MGKSPNSDDSRIKNESIDRSVYLEKTFDSGCLGFCLWFFKTNGTGRFQEEERIGLSMNSSSSFSWIHVSCPLKIKEERSRHGSSSGHTGFLLKGRKNTQDTNSCPVVSVRKELWLHGPTTGGMANCGRISVWEGAGANSSIKVNYGIDFDLPS